MDRRMRPRVTPNKKVFAFLNDAACPAIVMDYSAEGLKIPSLVGLKQGNHVDLDIVIDEELCACGMSGTVCWVSDNAAGIHFDLVTEFQVACSRDIESRFLCR